MVRHVTGFAGALQFLTRVPVHVDERPDVARCVPWFPVVGALVGAAAGGTAAALRDLTGPTVAAACGMIVGLLVTGAFHEDGLADVADAFGGAWTPAERMRILKDPRHGTYGVAALTASVVVRVACVASLPTAATAFAALVAAHALARGAAVGVMASVPAVGTDGLGASYAGSIRRADAMIGVVTATIIAAVLTGWWVGALVVAAAAGAAAVAWLAVRKIGGSTGDVLGAVEQVAECLVLVVAVGLAREHQLWWG
jgi:adenosylcobinamide-GDP ribazoletransferase